MLPQQRLDACNNDVRAIFKRCIFGHVQTALFNPANRSKRNEEMSMEQSRKMARILPPPSSSSSAGHQNPQG